MTVSLTKTAPPPLLRRVGCRHLVSGRRFRPDLERRATPVVIRDVLRQWQRYAVIAPELRSDVQAYPLESLGWTFLETDDARRAEEDQAWSAYAADRSGQLRLM